jgi:hypothetical protein
MNCALFRGAGEPDEEAVAAPDDDDDWFGWHVSGIGGTVGEL